MYRKEVNTLSPLRILEKSLHGGLGKGNLGVVMARAGVGKSACLVQIGLDELMRGRGVFHIAFGQTLDHVRLRYDSLFDDLAVRTGLESRNEARASVSKNRVIKTVSQREQLSETIATAIALFRKQTQFVPSVILVDGFDWSGAVEKTRAEFVALKTIAKQNEAELWLSVRTHRERTGEHPDKLVSPWDAYEQEIDVAIFLEPHTDHVNVRLLKDHDKAGPSATHLRLHPRTMRLVADDEKTEPLSVRGGITLLSGGARGAEAAFGECAEEYGLTEETYSFDGHDIQRTRGLVVLSDKELGRGDVSSAYLKAHMRREYPRTPLFRKVLASIWHQVSSSKEVFAVGVIHEDKTVMGGTGWAVELAKSFDVPVHVYDQDRQAWFGWQEGEWVTMAKDPVIASSRFTGTGTRILSDLGREAVRDLFLRSFGSSAS